MLIVGDRARAEWVRIERERRAAARGQGRFRGGGSRRAGAAGATFAAVASILVNDAQIIVQPSSLLGSSPLTGWNDVSGKGNHLSTVTGAPTRAAFTPWEGASGVHATAYVGGVTWATLMGGGPTQGTAFVVFKQNGNGGANAKGSGAVWNNPGVVGDTGQFASPFQLSTRAAVNYLQIAWWDAVEKSLEVTLPAQGSIVVGAFRWNGASLFLRANGVTDTRADFGTLNAGKANCVVCRGGGVTSGMADVVSYFAWCNVDIGVTRHDAALAALGKLYGVAA